MAKCLHSDIAVIQQTALVLPDPLGLPTYLTQLVLHSEAIAPVVQLRMHHFAALCHTLVSHAAAGEDAQGFLAELSAKQHSCNACCVLQPGASV